MRVPAQISKSPEKEDLARFSPSTPSYVPQATNSPFKPSSTPRTYGNSSARNPGNAFTFTKTPSGPSTVPHEQQQERLHSKESEVPFAMDM